MRTHRRHRILSASILSLLCASSAFAGSLTWDLAPAMVGPGDATITGGTGAWDNAVGNWTSDSGANNVAWDNTLNAADIAVFQGASGTVTLANAINLGGASFTSAGYSILSQALAFGSALGVLDTSALGTGSNVTTIGSSLTGTAGIFINSNGNTSATGGASTGRLELSGDNTGLTGGIAITGGLVRFTSSSAAGSAATTAGSGNTLTLSNGGGLYNSSAVTLGNNIVLSTGGGTLRSTSGQTLTLNGVISGSGGFNKTDSGTVLLANNANSFTGPVAVLGGTLRLGNLTAAGTFAFTGSELSVASGATLNMGGTSSGTIIQSYTFANLTAPISVSGGTLSFGSTNATTKNFNGALDFSGTNTLSYSSSAFTHALNLNRAITGAGTLNFTWSGGASNRSVNFASGQTNNFTGSVVLGAASGAVAMNLNSALGAADWTINDADWTVNLANTTNTFKSLNASVSGTVRALGSSSVLDVGSGNADFSFAGSLVNGGGVLTVVKSGTGKFTLSGVNPNTYSGGTTVSAGSLLVNTLSGLGSGSVSVLANGTLGGTGSIVPTGANGVSVAGMIAPGNGIGTLTVDLAGTTGGIVMTGGSFKLELGAAGSGINSSGVSDLLALTGAAAGDLGFSSTNIDFAGTGAMGWYKLFDTDFDGTTWGGLTLDGFNLVTAGLTAGNLADGLSAQFYVGDGTNGAIGDIYLQVVPEPGAAVALSSGLAILLGLRRRRRS